MEYMAAWGIPAVRVPALTSQALSLRRPGTRFGACCTRTQPKRAASWTSASRPSGCYSTRRRLLRRRLGRKSSAKYQGPATGARVHKTTCRRATPNDAGSVNGPAANQGRCETRAPATAPTSSTLPLHAFELARRRGCAVHARRLVRAGKVRYWRASPICLSFSGWQLDESRWRLPTGTAAA